MDKLGYESYENVWMVINGDKTYIIMVVLHLNRAIAIMARRLGVVR